VGEKKPLLSICIPTHNRAELLRSTLSAVAPQVKDLEDEVELLISDNCSVDNTKAVVDSFRESCPIGYHRNNENIGYARNIALLTDKLAHGEYGWIIGDDDTIRDGGVKKVVEILKAHRELDYVYVNYCPQIPFPSETKSPTSDADIDWSELGNKDTRERRVDRWEQLIEEDRFGLNAIFSSVFRLSLWRKAMSGLRMGTAPTNVVNLFPQTVILAKAMPGRPSWSTGYPWVANGQTISWTDIAPLVFLVGQDLLDKLEEEGIDPKYLRTRRRKMLILNGPGLAAVVNHPETQKPEGFSFRNFVSKYFEYGEMLGFVYFLACIDIRRGWREHPMISTLAIGVKPFALPILRLIILRIEHGRHVRDR
jgi:hypothetical protein